MNRLQHATSPYLLQHADNPVDWFEWGQEAFARALMTDRPILLSIGYAACHWCHVMAHESFEDPDVAALVNAQFVAVKVDREERPDVDAVYMQATQALTGHGGWPMTVFLTPDRQPFYAGTYFPPTPRHGLPSFGQLLEALGDGLAGAAGRGADQRGQHRRAAGRARRHRPARRGGSRRPRPRRGRAAARLRPAAGRLRRRPKFPPSMVLEALLREGGEDAALMARQTLDAMARGGIYDQLGGGFARYSVDAAWVVPHFEKMLYDNALLLGVYTHAWRRTGSALAARVVEETVGWLVREMRTDEGGFAASLDADSADASGAMEEGTYYVWTPDELARGARRGGRPLGRGGAGRERRAAPSSTARPPCSGSPSRTRSAGPRVRPALLAAREERPRPGRDDKVVAAWNGWLVDSLVQAATAFDRPDWLEHARAAAALVWDLHRRDGRLRRTSRLGVVGTAPGILEDYAALALAATRLAAALGDTTWLDRARELLEDVLALFDDAGAGFFDTAADAEQLFARPQDPTDNATPSGLSTAVHALRLFAELTGEDRWAERADRAAASAGGLVRQAPRFAGWLLADAVSRLRAAPVQVAVVGPAGPERDALATTAHRAAPAGSVVVAGTGDDAGFALLADRTARDGRPTAYVCRHFVCRLPVTSAEELRAQLVG